jgi:hypothetical protein
MGKRSLLQWRPAVAVAAMAVVAGVPLAASASEQAQVVRDAETGQLRAPTAAEAQALRAAGGKGSAPGAREASREIRHKDGTVEMRLDASTIMYSVARRQADGSISQSCVQGEDKALAATKAPASFAKPLRPVAAARTARGAVYEEQ